MLSMWVAHKIVTEKDIKQRLKKLKKIILVLKELYNLKNYSSLFSIFGAITMTSVFRLKKTFDLLSQKYQIIIEDIRKISEFDSNYKKLRNELKQNNNVSCIPHIGIFLGKFCLKIRRLIKN
jgi:son of sevenless-like protein